MLAILAALAMPSALLAQTRVLTGRVVDAASRAGVPGAIISVSGTTLVTQATGDGQFRLTIPASEVTVSFRGLGFRRENIRVPSTQLTIEVPLTREATQLSEVVVTGAATSQERRNIATAVSSVSSEEIARVPAASLDNALQGKIVGAQINMNSGAPGGGGQIQIRGVTSVLGNGEPLFVVDGVIISNATISTGINAVSRASGSGFSTTQDNSTNRLADVNPADIENVQVLKSAAATAIYGSKATNGVVLITTKRGRTGATRVGLTQRFGEYQATRLLGSRRFTQSALIGLIGNKPADSAVALSYCPAAQCPYYDYQGRLYGQNKLSHETQVSLSGGSENTKVFLSALHKDDRGTELATGAIRQSLRMNADHTFGSRFSSNVSAAISRSKSERGISNNDNTFVSPIYAFGYTPAVADLEEKVLGRYVDNSLVRTLTGIGTNPFQTLQSLRNVEDVWRMIASGAVRYNAYTGDRQSLAFALTGGLDRYNAGSETYSPNNLQYEADDGFLGTASQGEALSTQFNGTLSAVHTYTPGVRGMIPFLSTATTSFGAQYEDRALNRYSVIARGLVPTISLIDQGTPTIAQTPTAVRAQAFFANEELLMFSEKLSMSARVRAERSSVNGDRDKYFYWPAASAAYRFVAPFARADEIKLRAAVGTSGNQANYGNRDVTIAGLGLIDGRTALGVPGTLGNPSIEPEKMREFEYGMDAQFFDSRAGLEVNVFDRSITDLLLQAPLPQSSGYTQQFLNGGNLVTKGVEVAVNLVPVRGPVLWNARVQYSSFKSRVKSLPDRVADFPIANSGFGAQYGRGRIARGQISTGIWGNVTLPDSTVVERIIADANPKFQMNFSSDFTYKGFTVAGLLDWRKGGFVSNMTQNLFDEGSNSYDYDQASPVAG
ncbi:MAG: SusC/RagA family TonB-linked outer membrane protein, partial [Gemmatimonadaceae bacterium]|nr:SusC/RagA family TonB-linked outer membrane protein [Gemmatimonadaceae bacterium]